MGEVVFGCFYIYMLHNMYIMFVFTSLFSWSVSSVHQCLNVQCWLPGNPLCRLPEDKALHPRPGALRLLLPERRPGSSRPLPTALRNHWDKDALQHVHVPCLAGPQAYIPRCQVGGCGNAGYCLPRVCLLCLYFSLFSFLSNTIWNRIHKSSSSLFRGTYLWDFRVPGMDVKFLNQFPNFSSASSNSLLQRST